MNFSEEEKAQKDDEAPELKIKHLNASVSRLHIEESHRRKENTFNNTDGYENNDSALEHRTT
jgi:hypothetical protein